MLLFDQNISFRIVRLLKEAYPGCIHLSKCGLTDADDTEIWSYARKHGLAIVTFDQDYIDIAVVRRKPPKVILLRCGNSGTLALAHLLHKQHERIAEFLSDGFPEDVAILELS
ncbi:MAG: DUF5615 family PIN-like protein [Flavobacteriales bacterium]